MSWTLERAMTADVYEADLAELRDGCVPVLRAEVERLQERLFKAHGMANEVNILTREVRQLKAEKVAHEDDLRLIQSHARCECTCEDDDECRSAVFDLTAEALRRTPSGPVHPPSEGTP